MRSFREIFFASLKGEVSRKVRQGIAKFAKGVKVEILESGNAELEKVEGVEQQNIKKDEGPAGRSKTTVWFKFLAPGWRKRGDSIAET